LALYLVELLIMIEYKFTNHLIKELKVWKKKDKAMFDAVTKKINQIIENPEIGKPLSYSFKLTRRVHVGSYVLVYQYKENKIVFIDFDNHDNIYKKTFNLEE